MINLSPQERGVFVFSGASQIEGRIVPVDDDPTEVRQNSELKLKEKDNG